MTKLSDEEKNANAKKSLDEIFSSKPTAIIREQSLDKKEFLDEYKRIYKLASDMETALKKAHKIPLEKQKADGTYKQSEVWCGISTIPASDVPCKKADLKDKELVFNVSFRNGGELLQYQFDEELKLKDIVYCYNSFREADKTMTLASYRTNVRNIKESLETVYDFFTEYSSEYEKICQSVIEQTTERKLNSLNRFNQKMIALESKNKDGDISVSDLQKLDDGYGFSLKSKKENSAYEFHIDKSGKVDRIDYHRADIPPKFIGFSDTMLSFYARELADIDINRSYKTAEENEEEEELER